MFDPLMETGAYYPLPSDAGRIGSPVDGERWCASALDELAPPGVSLDDLNSWEYWDSVPGVAAPWGTPGMHWREYWVRLLASCRCSTLSPSQSQTMYDADQLWMCVTHCLTRLRLAPLPSRRAALGMAPCWRCVPFS